MRGIGVFLVTLALLIPLFFIITPTEAPIQDEEILPMETFVPDGKPSLEGAIIQDGNDVIHSTRAFDTPPYQMQSAIQHLVDNVSANYIKQYLLKLQGFGSRLYRAPSMANATKWMYEVLQGNGDLEVMYHNFTVDRGALGIFDLSNVIYTIPGKNTSSDRIYEMYAHCDSVQFDDFDNITTFAPGADDDGSGCAAIIEAARILSNHSFQDTIRFCFFQAEEIGLVGSGYWCANLSAWGDNVQGGICYDMIGYNSGTNQYDLELIYNSASSSQSAYMAAANQRYNIGLDLELIQTGGSIPSDIWRYYQNGFPSVMGIEDEFSPVYHTTQDLVKNMNMTMMQKTTKLAVGHLAEMARLLYVDLSIPPGNLTVSDTNPTEGALIDINATVLNTGNLNATDVEVVFNDNGEKFATKILNVTANNGTNSTGVQWTATGAGIHNISVIVDPINMITETDETNNSAWIKVEVNDIPTAVLIANPQTVLTGEEVTFNGSYSSDAVGGITEYLFVFHDGTDSGWITEPIVKHSYIDNGSYIPGLRVKDASGLISPFSTVDVTVLNRGPIANPWSNLTRTLTLVPIQFHANASDPDGNIVNYTWDLGDETISYEEEPVHNYTEPGMYAVSLDVMDNDGDMLTKDLSILIDNRGPACSINATPLEGFVSTEFTFTAEASDLDGTIAKYEWILGEEDTDTGQTVSKYFSTSGKFIIQLTVTDDRGETAIAFAQISVGDLPPIAIAKANPIEILTFEEVTFDGSDSSDPEGPLTFIWDFGDGVSSTKAKPGHSYSWPGNYTSLLTVFDSGGQNDTAIVNITVKNRGPTAVIETVGELLVNSTITFDGTDSSDPEGVVTYSWDFDDETSETDAKPERVFTKAGTYTVKLTVTDLHGATDTVEEDITITDEPISTDDDDTDDDVDDDVDDDIDDDIDDDTGDDDDDTEEAGMFNAATFGFLIIAIILLLLLIVVFIWGFTRGKKKKEEEEPPPQQQPVPPQQPPTQQPPQQPVAPQVATGQVPQQPVAQDQPSLTEEPEWDEPEVEEPEKPAPVAGKPVDQDAVPPSEQEQLPPGEDEDQEDGIDWDPELEETPEETTTEPPTTP
jgi:PKD repeat protein